MSDHLSHKTCCPQCEVPIHYDVGFPQWCPQCHWNISPAEPDKPKTVLEQFYERLGKKMSKALFEDVIRTPQISLFQHSAHGLAVVLALIFLGLNLFLLFEGIWLIWNGWPNPPSVFGGVICLLIAWIFRPRLGKWPKEDVFKRSDCPSLYQLVDQVAEQVGTSRISGIIVDEHFNASIAEIGWRRRKLLRIGLPLFSVLTSQERLAILGHEFGHGLNRDTFFSQILWIAIFSMCRWHNLFYYPRLWESRIGIFNIFVIPWLLLLRGVAKIVYFMIYAVLHLSWSASQRAEYMADLAGARLAGANAMASALEKLHSADDFEFLVRKFTLQNRHNEDLFALLKDRYDTLPEREKERRRVSQELYSFRLDSTHPPTRFRIGFITSKNLKVEIEGHKTIDMNGFERELFIKKKAIQAKLMDRYLDGLYY